MLLRYFFLLLFSSAFVLACQGPEAESRAEIERLEPLVQENPVDSNLRRLMVFYQRFVEQAPQHPQSPVYLYRCAEWYLRVGNLGEASKQLERIIESYPDSPVHPSALILAAMTYEERMNMANRAKELYELYLKRYPQGPEAEQAALFFKPEQERIAKRIERIRDTLFRKDRREELNQGAALLLLQAYKDFVDRHENENQAPQFAYDGGILAKNMGDIGLAVYFLRSFAERYPSHALHPEALFSLATSLENEFPRYRQNNQRQEERRKQGDPLYKKQVSDIQDEIKEAELIYREFLKRYPQHHLRPVVEQSLQYLGKDPNDLAAEFARKLKEQRK